MSNNHYLDICITGNNDIFENESSSSDGGIRVRLPECEESCKDESIYSSILYDNNKKVDKKYSIKIVVHGRICGHSVFLFDNESIKKCKKVREYTVLPLESGYLVVYIKMCKNGDIDYNYYMKYGNKMELLYINGDLFGKMIEEDMDLGLYLQTLLKDDYKKLVGSVYVIKNVNYLRDISVNDVIFYGSQLYLLLK